MGLIQSFVRNPVSVAVGVLLTVLFGVVGLLAMPMQLTPEVQTPTISITTTWPGASPQEIERSIVQEQEEQLNGVEGVVKMSSESSDSRGEITLEFNVGTDMSEALIKVNSRLQQVPEYPEDADEPVIKTSSSSDRAIAWFILGPRVATIDEIDGFLDRHPALSEPMARVKASENPALRLFRLRQVAAAHPAAEELLPPEIDVAKERRFALEVLAARFRRVAGVSDSEVNGGREIEMQVVVDPARLAARQLTISELRTALRAQNHDISGGDFWEGKRRYPVRTLGQFKKPEQVAAVIIARRDGQPVYVRDVAEVQLEYKKPDGMVRRYGETRIAMNVKRTTGANVLDVMEGLREALDEMNSGVLASRNLELVQVYDETDYINSAVGLVRQNIVVGGILTVAVLLLFLRSVRSTLIVGLAIPTSIMGTFLMLGYLGRSLNVVSLAGMAFAVGMLVDNAIVVLENIYRHWQRGESSTDAAVEGSAEVWGAVVASTLTTLAVFIPVLFIQEEAGQLFRDIALAISCGVGLSLIVSISVIPAAAAVILRRRTDATLPEEMQAGGPAGGAGIGEENFDDEFPEALVVAYRQIDPAAAESAAGETSDAPPGAPSTGRSRAPGERNAPADGAPPGHASRLLAPVDRFGAAFVWLIVETNRFLQRNLAARIATVAGFVGATVLLSWLLAPKVEYLPGGNRNLTIGILLPPPGYNIDQTAQMGTLVEEHLRPFWDLEPGDPNYDAMVDRRIGDFFFVARGRNVFLGLRASDEANAANLVNLVRSVTGELEGTMVVANQTSLFESGLTAGRSIDIELTGPELTTLVATGGRVLGQVKELIDDVQVRPEPSLDLSNPEVHVLPKWDQAADLNVDTETLGYTVSALIDGAYAGDYYLEGDKIDLVIIGDKRYVGHSQDINELPVATPSGQLATLGAVADVVLSSGPEQINRRERQRAVTIKVTPPPEMALEEAMQQINDEIVVPLRTGGALPPGYQIHLAGTADKLRATWSAMRWNLLLALLITYLLMAALFESWLYPLVIIFSVPLGAVGGLIGLALLNLFTFQPLDVLTMLGFIILIGVVVNNAILIVHHSINLMRDEGVQQQDAILESVRTRVRPIFMTTGTTVLGLLPLVLFPGAGSELYRGLGSVVLGGLIVSTLFTLVLVPTLFSLALHLKQMLVGSGEPRESGRRPEPLPEPKRTAPVAASTTP